MASKDFHILVGHHQPSLYEGNFHEGLQFLALCRQRVVRDFPWKAERTQMSDFVGDYLYSGQESISAKRRSQTSLEQDLETGTGAGKAGRKASE